MEKINWADYNIKIPTEKDFCQLKPCYMKMPADWLKNDPILPIDPIPSIHSISSIDPINTIPSLYTK